MTAVRTTNTRDDSDADRELVSRALAGSADARRAFVVRLLPVVQARIARLLARRRGGSGRDVRQEVEDIAQEVFVALFESDARALRAWDPARGSSLAGFCGLIAERETASILRSGRRSPWKEVATEEETLDRELASVPASALPSDAEARLATRQQLALVVMRVKQCLSPMGIELFERLIVDEAPAESVCMERGMSADAVYAWKSRLGKLVRKVAAELAAEEDAVSETAAPARSR